MTSSRNSMRITARRGFMNKAHNKNGALRAPFFQFPVDKR